jgi:polypeptide N-acetylgalactosaminyltransferase
LDEYKQYLYKRHPERYAKVDIGDISGQLILKKKLNCKPFSYYLNEIAPDLVERYPLKEPDHFASGTV